MNLSAIHKNIERVESGARVVCDIGGYEFVSYSQAAGVKGVEYVRCV